MKSKAVRLNVNTSCPSSTSHEAYVLVLYAHIYHGLRQERQHQLQQAAQQQAHGYLPEVPPVLLHVPEEEAQRAALALRVIVAMSVKRRSGFNEHCHSPILFARARAHPVLLHILCRPHYKSLARVGNIIPPAAAPHAVKHNEVVLVPVQYAWQRNFRQLFQAYASAHRVQSQPLSRLAYAQQRHALRRCKAQPRQILRAVLPAIMLAHHAQAGHSALHRVMLDVCLKLLHQFIISESISKLRMSESPGLACSRSANLVSLSACRH